MSEASEGLKWGPAACCEQRVGRELCPAIVRAQIFVRGDWARLCSFHTWLEWQESKGVVIWDNPAEEWRLSCLTTFGARGGWS